MKVDVIIPTYKPGKKLSCILKMLSEQTVKPNRIILINTEEKYFNAYFYGSNELDNYKNLVIKHISQYEFDHGKTRDMGVMMSDADYFVCMTDDAVPLDNRLIEELLKPVVQGLAAVSYARQCVSKNSSIIERYTRRFNYPSRSILKSKDDIDKLGIKTYFCSNVCACYNRSIYNELGGFIDRTIFNEDMIYAATAVKAGYSIAYCSEAKVKHEHHYGNMQQLRRNFDLGVSQSCHPEIFKEVPSTGEGKKLVKSTARFLLKNKKGYLIIKLVITSGFKFLGYQLGMHYKWLPKSLIYKITMNPVYWAKE